MNWTGGRRARHNSNASFNTTARLQKQYFARVRMAREARQATATLVRSSSPISLANALESHTKGERQHDGYGLEGTLQGKSRSIWGSKTSAVHNQQGESNKQQGKDEEKVQKRTGTKSKILALELGGNADAVSKKPGATKRRKNLLLGEADWLGTKKKNTFFDEDESKVHEPIQSNEECTRSIGHEEESDIGSENDGVILLQDEENNHAILFGAEEDDDAILLEEEEICELLPIKNNSKWQNTIQPHMRTNISAESIDGSESIFLEVGNVHFSRTRGKAPISNLVPKTLMTLPEENIEIQSLSSDSILLNFEDAVLPSILGNFHQDSEPGEEIALPVHLEFLTKVPSNSESFFTWSSSDYVGKKGNETTHKHLISDAIELDSNAQLGSSQQSPGNSETKSACSPTLPPLYFEDSHSRDLPENFLHSQQNISRSSLDVALSILESEAQSDDNGQWIDMMLKEYYLDERREDSHCGSQDKHIDGQDDVRNKNIKCTPVAEAIYRARESSGARREDQSWQEIGLENTEGDNLLEKAAEDNMKDNGLPKGLTNPKVKPILEIDLDDDKAWRDFVYQSCIEENWEEELAALGHLNSTRYRKRKYSFGGESEDDFISPLDKKKRGVTSSSSVDMNSDIEVGTENSHILVDVESNAATMGTNLSSSVLDSENNRELDYSTAGNDPSLPNSDNITNGYSSIVANASSSPKIPHFTTSTSLEVESTVSIRSIASSPPKFTSALKDKNKDLQSERKKVIWGEDVRYRDSGEEESLIPKRLTLTRRNQTELGTTRSITKIKKMFEVSPGKGGKGGKEPVEQIEEW